MEKISDEILLEYLDGTLEARETELLRNRLQNDVVLKVRLEELKQADQYLNGVIDNPSPRFADIVWTKISEASKAPTFRLNGFLIVIASMLTVIAGSYFMTDGIVELNLKIPATVSEYVTVPQIELPEGINLKMISQVLLYGLSFLILLILDKAILKPYFRKRKAFITGS